jgi:S-formylglutathione hydrolase FrmB
MIEGCGEESGRPLLATGPIIYLSFHSVARGRETEVMIAYPPGYEPSQIEGDRGPDLRVCVVMHGAGDTARTVDEKLAAPAYLAAAIADGAVPFVLVAVDSADTYWHRRADGDDPEAMLFEELLPLLAARGLRVDRIALLGWSMGGYGGLLLALRHPDRIAAVAASSPAVWHSFRRATEGAFDSAADFRAHRVLGVGPAPGVAYRIDCGHADKFNHVARALAAELAADECDFPVGCHGFCFWRRQLPAQLGFVSRALYRTGEIVPAGSRIDQVGGSAG